MVFTTASGTSANKCVRAMLQSCVGVRINVKHFTLIQLIICEIANGCLRVSTSLLSAKDAERAFAIVSYLPCVMFWYLDAYYLSQERKFRSLYDSVRQDSKADYSMDTTKSQQPRDCWAAAFFSQTMLVFHVSILAVI